MKDYFRNRSRTYKSYCKPYLIQEVAEVTGLSQDKVRIIVETILSQIVQSIRKGERVEIRGFGVFDTHSRPIRIYGPRVYFRPSSALRQMVNPRKS